MKKSVAVPSQYLQIALDLAGRIARGELPEGKRLYGRSLLASEYGVSPETVRRALRLLADMKVVEIRPQSGVIVLSADSARRYIDSFSDSADIWALQAKVKELFAEDSALHSRLESAVKALLRSQDTFAAEQPFPNYEVPIPDGSPVIGKSIGELKFWQATGGTVVAIRRGRSVILSPGPYAEFFAGDTIILVGHPGVGEAVNRLISGKETL